MILQKWDYATEQYAPYEVPDSWNVVLLTDDMKQVVSCVQCGTKLEYGKCYTSKEVHTRAGFGFPVCSECYEAEIQRYFDNRKKEEVQA